jgi:hypothetical protein
MGCTRALGIAKFWMRIAPHERPGSPRGEGDEPGLGSRRAVERGDYRKLGMSARIKG